MLPHSCSASFVSTVSSDFTVQAITISYVKYRFLRTIERYIHYVQNLRPYLIDTENYNQVDLKRSILKFHTAEIKYVPNKEPLESKLFFIYVFLTDCVVKESGCQSVQNIHSNESQHRTA